MCVKTSMDGRDMQRNQLCRRHFQLRRYFRTLSRRLHNTRRVRMFGLMGPTFLFVQNRAKNYGSAENRNNSPFGIDVRRESEREIRRIRALTRATYFPTRGLLFVTAAVIYPNRHAALYTCNSPLHRDKRYRRKLAA